MAQGKFSQPRPHRDEERQIEQAFRQLTEDKSKTHRPKQISSEDARMEQLLQQNIGQEPASQPLDAHIQAEIEKAVADAMPQEPVQQALDEDAQIEQAFRQVTGQPAAPQRPASAGRKPEYDLLPDDMDAFFEGGGNLTPEEPEASEPDFVDKLMAFADKAVAFCGKNKKAVTVGVCGVALVLIVVFIAVFFAGATDPYDSKILDNVYLADVNVGGMTKNEAISAVKQATSKTYSSQDMVIDLSGNKLLLTAKDTGAELDVKAAVNAAYEYGRTGTQSEREQVYNTSKTEDHIIGLLPYLDLDTDYIKDTLTAYAEDSGSTLTQTTYGLEGDEPELSAEKFDEDAPCQTLVILMGTPGVGFDVNDVYNQVLDAYSLHQFLVTVEDVESVKEPDPIDLEAIYEEFYIEPVDATINMQTFETISGSYGYGFDLEKAQKLVDEAEYGEEIRIPMEYIEPDILDGDSFFNDVLGEAKSRQSGNDNRVTNLRLACEAIDGTILNPGETLTFSQKISSVKFKSAAEDTGMDTVSGGGASQVSSTLYYAALCADLDIVSRNNLGYVPSFADYGFDAATGLKIRNSLGYPIRIDAELSGSYVKIQIMGTEERDYYVTLDYTIAGTYQPETEYEDFEYNNAEGYLDGDVLEEGTTGYLVKTYKVKYDNKTGQKLSRDFITNSQYPTTNRLVARVEEPEETTVPTETTAPTETTTAPTESSTPTESSQPTESSTPSESTQATDPPASSESSEPVESSTAASEESQQESLTSGDGESQSPEE